MNTAANKDAAAAFQMPRIFLLSTSVCAFHLVLFFSVLCHLCLCTCNYLVYFNFTAVKLMKEPLKRRC